MCLITIYPSRGGGMRVLITVCLAVLCMVGVRTRAEEKDETPAATAAVSEKKSGEQEAAAGDSKEAAKVEEAKVEETKSKQAKTGKPEAKQPRLKETEASSKKTAKKAPPKTAAEAKSSGKAAGTAEKEAAAESAPAKGKNPEKKASDKQSSKQEESAPARQKETGETAVKVSRAAVCTAIVDREPVGSATKFEKGIAKLYCFSHIKGCPDTMQIVHTWYHQGDKAGLVPLVVRSPSWRTYSSRNIGEGQVGAWKVEISENESGVVLETVSFTIQ
ncbi:MAG: DUF2914 domain-containing protein [Chitinivibrionales bacterium]|nr:DUF2914 domain-containing protein [Chitinivibrionales bacterium]